MPDTNRDVQMGFHLACQLQLTGRGRLEGWVEKASEAKSGLMGEEYHEGTVRSTGGPTSTLAILAVDPATVVNS